MDLNDLKNNKDLADMVSSYSGAITGFFGVLSLLFKPIRVRALMCWKWIWLQVQRVGAMFVAPLFLKESMDKFTKEQSDRNDEIIKNLQKLNKTSEEHTVMLNKHDTDLDDLKKKLNDGIAPHLGRIQAMNNFAFVGTPTPQFICNAKGENILASHAYRVLCGAKHDDALDGNGWMTYAFIGEPEKAAEYQRAFQRASESNPPADFRGKVKISGLDEFGNFGYRGEWDVAVHVLDSKQEGEVLYVGRLFPADETSETIHKKHRWR